MLKLRDRLYVIIGLLALLVATPTVSAAGPLEDAAIAGEWQAVHDSLVQIDERDAVEDVLYVSACLVLDSTTEWWRDFSPIDHEALQSWSRKLEEEYGNGSMVHTLIGTALIGGAPLPEINEHFEKAIELDSANFLALMQYGVVKIMIGHTASGLKLLERAVALKPNHIQAVSNRATAYQQLGMYERALDDFSKAIDLKPNLAATYYNRGNTYRALKQNDSAIADYTTALGIDSTLAVAYYNRANALRDKGELLLALSDYEKARDFAGDLVQLRHRAEREIETIEQQLNRSGDTALEKFDGQFEDESGARETIRSAYDAWEQNDWAELAEYVLTDDLEKFKELCAPVMKALFRENEKFVLLNTPDGQQVFSLSGIMKAEPPKFFVYMMSTLVSSGAQETAFLGQVTAGEIVEFSPQSDRRARYGIELTAENAPGESSGVGQGAVEREEGDFKIAMPDLLMNVALALNATVR